MGISLAGTEAWAVGDKLEPGSYIASFAVVERKQSSNDNEQVQVDLRVLKSTTGDTTFKGAEQRDWITFTDSSGGRVVQVLQAIGQETPQQDFATYGELADWVAGALKKAGPVEIVVRMKPDRKDPSKEWPEVAGYRKPNPSDLDNDASGFTSGPNVGNGNGAAAAEKLPF